MKRSVPDHGATLLSSECKINYKIKKLVRKKTFIHLCSFAFACTIMDDGLLTACLLVYGREFRLWKLVSESL